MLAALVIAFLFGAPFAALATGAWVHAMARQAQLTQEASRHQVTAVVLSVSPPGAEELAWQAQARWQAPNGRMVTDQVPVLWGTAAGGKLQVWTDRAGGETTAPLVDSQVAGQADLGDMVGVIGSAAVVTAAGALIRVGLNKRRMAAWETDWHATGPRWTTRA